MAALIPSANASGSGTMTLAGPATNSNQTITIPDATGTMMVSGNMPAFSAFKTSTNQTYTQNTNTKVVFDAEEFDTANCFDSTTNYRFTPNVAGYYQLTCGVGQNNSTSYFELKLYKNGSYYRQFVTAQVSQMYSLNGTTLVYANGTTDYFEVYVYATGTSPTLAYTNAYTFFQGSLVRTA